MKSDKICLYKALTDEIIDLRKVKTVISITESNVMSGGESVNPGNVLYALSKMDKALKTSVSRLTDICILLSEFEKDGMKNIDRESEVHKNDNK